MLQSSRNRLAEFIRRADNIESLSYLENRENLIGGNFEKTEDGEVNFYQPNDEKRAALLFNLRLFVQDKDQISIRRLTELFDDPGFSQEWKDEIRLIRSDLNERLQRIAAEGDKGKIAHRDVFNMFLYGSLGHHDPRDRAYQLYELWVTDETEFEILHNTFHVVLVWIITAIMNISRASKEELARSTENGTDPPES